VIGDELFGERTIAERVRRLGEEISADYAGRNPVIVGILTSSAIFVADLTRAVRIPCEFDFIALSRYSDERGIHFVKDTSESIEGRDVVLVEDTIDTGLTLRYITKTLLARAPASLEVCALLDRPHRRIADVPVKYRGFEIPDVFVVGYGLDYAGRYRELPGLFAHGSWPK
jgi:hypoxanthine phosphoribosyltransferase